MNQRMIELYQEASEFAYKICKEQGREGGTSDHIWNTLSTGKFAELIVQDCIGIVADAVDHREPASTYVSKIKQHFGVE